MSIFQDEKYLEGVLSDKYKEIFGIDCLPDFP